MQRLTNQIKMPRPTRVRRTPPLDLPRLHQTGPDLLRAETSNELAVHIDGFIIHAIIKKHEESHENRRPAVVLQPGSLGERVVEDWGPGGEVVHARPRVVF